MVAAPRHGPDGVEAFPPPLHPRRRSDRLRAGAPFHGKHRSDCLDARATQGRAPSLRPSSPAIRLRPRPPVPPCSVAGAYSIEVGQTGEHAAPVDRCRAPDDVSWGQAPLERSATVTGRQVAGRQGRIWAEAEVTFAVSLLTACAPFIDGAPRP